MDPSSGGEPVASSPEPDSECEVSPTEQAAAPAPGGTTDSKAPTVIGARFMATDRVQLTFSEPLAPSEQVNPRQFRLSMAYSMIEYGYGYGSSGSGSDESYASGYYYDLAGNDNYEPQLVVIGLEGYDDRPEVLALRLSRPVPTELCEGIKESEEMMIENAADGPGGKGEVGLYLHYTERGSVGVRDLANNSLEDIGAEWALHFGARNKTVYGTEPIMRLDLLVKLACPDGMSMSGPPGPN